MRLYDVEKILKPYKTYLFAALLVGSNDFHCMLFFTITTILKKNLTMYE